MSVLLDLFRPPSAESGRTESVSPRTESPDSRGGSPVSMGSTASKADRVRAEVEAKRLDRDTALKFGPREALSKDAYRARFFAHPNLDKLSATVSASGTIRELATGIESTYLLSELTKGERDVINAQIPGNESNYATILENALLKLAMEEEMEMAAVETDAARSAADAGAASGSGVESGAASGCGATVHEPKKRFTKLKSKIIEHTEFQAFNKGKGRYQLVVDGEKFPSAEALFDYFKAKSLGNERRALTLMMLCNEQGVAGLFGALYGYAKAEDDRLMIRQISGQPMRIDFDSATMTVTGSVDAETVDVDKVEGARRDPMKLGTEVLARYRTSQAVSLADCISRFSLIELR